MRVLIVATWPTHYQPMVPLAWALGAAGHDIRVAVPPDHADSVVGSGQAVVPAGPAGPAGAGMPERYKRDVLPLITAGAGDADAYASHPTARRARRTRASIGIYLSLAAAMAPDIVAFARRWRPDLVVHEPTAFAGPLVAALFGVPAVRHLWGPDATSAGPGRGGPLVDPALTELAAAYGLADFDTRGDVTVDPCPASLQTAVQGTLLPMRYVPYNGSMSRPPARLAPALRPRVCVSWGFSTVELAGTEAFLAPRVVEALGELPVEIVVTAGARHHHLLGGPRAGVTVVEMELRSLLPSCHALVHQGGGGTMLTAVACGVPQLVVPKMPDQRFSAQQLARTGAGRVVEAGAFDDGSVRDAVRALLTDAGLRAGVARLRAENAARPSPARVAARLEKLAGP